LSYKVDLNKLRVYVKNKMTLTCAKFGADVTNTVTFKFTNRKK